MYGLPSCSRRCDRRWGEAGQLDTVLFKLAQIYKDDVDNSISVFSSILEPLLLFVMGLFVALIVWAVYLPYFMLPDLL